LLNANQVAKKSRAAGARVPVQAATTSWMVQGVTRTMNPKDIAAIVLDAVVLRRLSWVTNCNTKQVEEDDISARLLTTHSSGATVKNNFPSSEKLRKVINYNSRESRQLTNRFVDKIFFKLFPTPLFVSLVLRRVKNPDPIRAEQHDPILLKIRYITGTAPAPTRYIYIHEITAARSPN
jgi:hypothetical protein